jgi:hypothetical protein
MSGRIKFGIRMEGCEDRIEALVVEQVRAAVERAENFNYVEIGVAMGETLREVTRVVREVTREWVYDNWRTIGVDLPDGYALNMGMVRAAMPEVKVWGLSGLEPDRVEMAYGRPNMVLWNSVEFLTWWGKRMEGERIDVALVDGCHGKWCVMQDFLALEPLMAPGGIVIFHDAGIADQGFDFQPHCKEGINVRMALWTLGLLPDGGGMTKDQARKDQGNPKAQIQREGWEWVEEIPGDKARGGNSCVVVRRK